MFDLAVFGIIVFCVLLSFYRGFVGEVLGLLGIIGAFAVTFYHFDYFGDFYRTKFSLSDALADVASCGTVFGVTLITFMIINGWILHMTSEYRCGMIDRFGGIVIGAIKGVLFSYVLFFTCKVVYYVVPSSHVSDVQMDKQKDKLAKDKKEEDDIMDLPAWLVGAKSYKYMNYIDHQVNENVSSSVKESMMRFGQSLERVVAAHEHDKKDKKR